MICPYCRGGFEEQGPSAPWACAACGTAVHAECAAAHEGCVTYGCTSVELAPARLSARRGTLAPRLPLRTRARAALADSLAFAGAPLSAWAVAAYALLGVGALALRLG